MRKILLALALCLLTTQVFAANRFWVGGTGTWNSSNTTSWSTSSGGGGGASVPGTGDAAVFDASSCAAACTITVDSPNGAGVVTVQSITWGACTNSCSIDFSANNNNVTLTLNSSAFNGSGSGTRTFDAGSGTWTLNGSFAGNTVWTMQTTTNLTNPTTAFANATIVFTTNPSGAPMQIQAGSVTYGTITFSDQSNRSGWQIQGNPTINTLNVGSIGLLTFASGTTTLDTVNFTNGTTPVLITGAGHNVTPTLSKASGSITASYVGLRSVTGSGGATFTANNSISYGGVTGWTVNAPSGGGGQGIIGGGM